MTPPTHRIIANLDCEATFAGSAAPLPLAVRRRMARVGSLLRVFAPDDATGLWLPAELPAAEWPDVGRGLPMPQAESGPLGQLEPAARTLWWGAVADRVEPAHAHAPVDHSLPLHEQVWQWPQAALAAAARANDRAFALDVARELGCALPDAARIDSVADLDRWLGERAADQPVVLKARWCAAGRDRARGTPDEVRDAAARLLERHGALVAEPWMARTHDVSLSAVVTARDHHVIGLQENRVDEVGRFRGIRLCLHPGWPASLVPDERDTLLATAAAVADRLRTIGYAGPFGLDAWRYDGLESDGLPRFHPLGEINARLTFAFVARALAERVVAARAASAGTVWQLTLPPGDAPVTFEPV